MTDVDTPNLDSARQLAATLPVLSLPPDVEVALRRSNLLDSEAGRRLWHYWTRGPGLARWKAAPRPWTVLHRLLLEEGVPEEEAAGLSTNIFMEVFGETPAEHAAKLDKRPGKGRKTRR